VETVLHVKPANEPSAFLHRSGRTGRAGASGTNVVVFFPDDREHTQRLRDFERANGTRFEVRAVPVVQDAADNLEGAKRRLRQVSNGGLGVGGGDTSTEAAVTALLGCVGSLALLAADVLLLL